MNDSRNNIQKYITAYQETLSKMGAEGIKAKIALYSEFNQYDGLSGTVKNPSQIGEFWMGTGNGYFPGYVYYASENGSLGSIKKFNESIGVRPIIIIEY